MAKKKENMIGRLMHFVAWLTGIIVSLSVGFAMTSKILSLPSWLGGPLVAVTAGWIVIITTILGVILALMNYFK